MATNNENKGIFVKTIELIGSIIAIMLFATILFGIFMSSLERMLWQLFDWIIEILKPIVSILLLFVGVLRGIPLLVSFIESIIEDMRAEKEYTEVWDRLDRSPTPQVDTIQKTVTEPLQEPKTDQTTQSRGETIIVVVPSKNGGQFLHVVPGTKEHQDALAQKAAAEKELDMELKEAVNEKLKDLKKILVKSGIRE
ncbi:MAG TPA: hypothetical protein PKL30_22735 [Leptospiraceae bacterium]|jgi:hypothetical protein|nr:hypothetical protein [Leptospiraceae bacterium]HNA09493.1 hypothetical protein [Leptospiraceae bacterium]HNF57434.1 hypothetical protein [Leptospiraceae bacterium]HNH03035.1 hypothetical protein [Leptospiraceae bacterium]HNH57845.1 hypothetical protein [Leptospiraceae bacterium]